MLIEHCHSPTTLHTTFDVSVANLENAQECNDASEGIVDYTIKKGANVGTVEARPKDEAGDGTTTCENIWARRRSRRLLFSHQPATSVTFDVSVTDADLDFHNVVEILVSKLDSMQN